MSDNVYILGSGQNDSKGMHKNTEIFQFFTAFVFHGYCLKILVLRAEPPCTYV